MALLRGAIVSMLGAAALVASPALATDAPIERLAGGISNAQDLDASPVEGIFVVSRGGSNVFRVQLNGTLSSLTSANVPQPQGVAAGGTGGFLVAWQPALSAVKFRKIADDGTFTDALTEVTDVSSLRTTLDGDGYYASYAADPSVFRVSAGVPATTRIAGNGSGTGAAPSATDPTSGSIGRPTGLTMNPQDPDDYAFTSVTGSTGKAWVVNNSSDTGGDSIALVAGGGDGSSLGDGGLAKDASLNNPSAIAWLADGGYLIYDAGNARIRRVSPGGPDTATIETIAGNGTVGLAAAGTPADQAPLAGEGDMVVKPSGIVMSQGSHGVVQQIPAVAVASGPPAQTTSRTAAFTFSSWDDAAKFTCVFDESNVFEPCEASYGGFADGVHTLRVAAATNAETMQSRETTYTWEVDGTAPAPFALGAPAEGSGQGASVAFNWAASSDTGVGIDRYELWVDGAKAASPACCEMQLTVPDGQHTWQVKAIDKLGNVRESEQRSFSVTAPPGAALSIAPQRALTGRPVSFDASASSDSNGTLTKFEWDLDGDGSFESSTGADPRTSRSYDRPQTLTVAVRVTDSGGLTAVANGLLTITAPPPAGRPLGVSINDGAQYTNSPDVTVHSVWPAFASNMLVSNDGGFKLAQTFPVAETAPWKLDSSGPERLPKTIYVRFFAGLQTSETYQDDIILDQTAPKVVVATLPAARAARAAAARHVTLKLRATDNVSGVSAAQVTKSKRRPGRFLRFKRSLKVVPAKRLYVRVRDRAGNLSAWRLAKRR